MPLSLVDLQRNKRTIPVETPFGELEIVYRPSAITQDAITSGSIYETLAEGLEVWDLLDEGQMVPITVENLKALPHALILPIFHAIMEDVTARPTKRAASLGAR